MPNEPTAAALYYGTREMDNGDCILVYDLGGGTMDATVLEYRNRTFSVLSSDGSQSLGGKDWTDRLVDFVSDEYEAVFGVFPSSDRRLEQMVYEECEKSKHMLTRMDRVKIPLSSYDGKIHEVLVSLEQFEEMTDDLLLETLIKAESALQKARMNWNDCNRVLLVGGATRMRMVEQALTRKRGSPLKRYRDPDTLVVLGAALYTRQKIASNGKRQIAIAQQSQRSIAVATQNTRKISLITVEESTTHGLGTVIINRQGKSLKLATSVIIKPHTQVPAFASRDDYETEPHQVEVDIPIVQTDADGLDPYNCHINKTYRFSGIPDRDGPSRISVTFQYNKDAIIDVSAKDLTSNRELEKQVIDFTLPDLRQFPSDLHIIIALDTSGSMGGQPLADAKLEVKKVCTDLEASGCFLGVIQFGAEINVVHPLTDNLHNVYQAVEPLLAGNGTPMGDGILLALEQFNEVKGKRIIILVSDGFPNNEFHARETAKQVKQVGITLYTISIGYEGAAFLQSIGDAYRQIESAAYLSDAIRHLLQCK